MAPSFLKLAHANDHFTAIGDAVREFLKTNEVSFGTTPTAETGWQSVRVTDVPELPLDWGVVLGDGLHDLRSALDNAVAALIRLASGDPDHRSEFPILTDTKPSDRAAKLKGALRGVLEHYQIPIREAQPYRSNQPKSHPLAILQSLSNADKHRLVHLGTVAPTGGTYRFRTTTGNKVVEHTPAPEAFDFTCGKELVRLRTSPDPAAPIEVEMAFAVQLGFSPSRGAPITTTMRGLGDIYLYLDALLRSLIPFFERHIKVELPPFPIEPGDLLELAPSHMHGVDRVIGLPVGQQETQILADGVHTYRLYECPQCHASSYAEIAADVTLA